MNHSTDGRGIDARSETGEKNALKQEDLPKENDGHETGDTALTRPMRWAQLTFGEKDPEQFDLEFWLDYFERTHSEGACISAGGYVAYYPTDIPFHHRSAWLGDSDPFGDLVEGCKKRGMVVLARTDPHAVHEVVFDAHPEWIAVDHEGNKRRHWAKSDAWVTCPLGPYNFEFMTEVHKEIARRYPVDGIFSNRWAGHGICYCKSCRKMFDEAYGLKLPRTQTPEDPSWRAYFTWRQKRQRELIRLWDQAVREVRPSARFIPNTSGAGALSEFNTKAMAEMVDVLFADQQGRSGTTPLWANGKNAKEYRAVMGSKPVGGIFAVGVTHRNRWMASVQSEAELRMWVADGVANGLRPWFTKFGAVNHDDRWLAVVEDIYKTHHRHGAYLKNQASMADVGLVFSQNTARFHPGGDARRKAEEAVLGFYQALIEARIPFDMVHDEKLNEKELERFQTLILPDIALLSDEQCHQIRRFVARGGNLVATHETSLFNEWGARRHDFGLADLFGVSYLGAAPHPMPNAYLLLEGDPSNGERHALLDGLDYAQRIIHGSRRLNVGAIEPVKDAPLTLVPSYPDLPMEEVFPRSPSTAVPEVYLRERGGRVVYFPWDIDRIYWDALNVDHGLLLANAVKWASSKPFPVSVTGPGMLDVAVWRQKESVTVHLVNLTNPMMMKGPVRDLIPVGEQQVEVRLPEGAQVRRVKLLRQDEELAEVDIERTDDGIRVTVPSVRDYEIVAIDL